MPSPFPLAAKRLLTLYSFRGLKDHNRTAGWFDDSSGAGKTISGPHIEKQRGLTMKMKTMNPSTVPWIGLWLVLTSCETPLQEEDSVAFETPQYASLSNDLNAKLNLAPTRRHAADCTERPPFAVQRAGPSPPTCDGKPVTSGV